MSKAYTVDSNWRNRTEFFVGREAIKEFLTRKWAKEQGYRLMKELWYATTTSNPSVALPSASNECVQWLCPQAKCALSCRILAPTIFAHAVQVLYKQQDCSAVRVRVAR